MEITKRTWFIIGGVGIAALSVGGYLLWKSRKTSRPSSPSLAIPKGKAIKIVKGGNATTLVTPDWNSPFDMNYIKDVQRFVGKPIKVLDAGVAENLARKLFAAKGRFNDDEDAVAEVFSALQDKTQVAMLSKAFYGLKGKDLYQYLRSFLSSSEFKKLVGDPVRRLPKYQLA